MNHRKIFYVFFLTVLLVATLSAQTTRQRGVIRGVVTDTDGEPLPGVTVTALSPALLGAMTDVTSATGVYRCPNLPPGTYSVLAEIPAFQPVKKEGIEIRIGIVLMVNFALEATTLTEEVLVVAANPTVDVKSLKIVTRFDKEILQRLPVGRIMANVIGLAPGVVEDFSSAKLTGMGTGTIHGGTAYGQSFEVDGVNVVDPAHGGAILFTPQYDSIEEISVETGGLEAQVGNTAGNFINIVTKSGGNEFHGTLTTYYTRESFTQSLYPPEQLVAMGVGKPSSPIYDYDLSASIGGPIIKDKLWFFSTLAYQNKLDSGNFIPTTIEGVFYDTYDYPDSFKDVMLKISAQLAPNMRFYLTGAFSEQDLTYTGRGSRNTIDTGFSKDNNRRMTVSSQLSWHLSSDSILDIRAGIARFDYPIYPNSESGNKLGKTDGYTNYSWAGPSSWASDIDRNTKQVSVRLTQYMDDFMGGDHEFGMGVEYQYGKEQWWLFRVDPVRWYFYNGNPYYYRGRDGLDAPHPIYGDGRLMLQTMGPTNGGTGAPSMTRRLAAYIQDSWTINNRLTFTLGARIDDVKGWIAGAVKERAGGIAVAIGEKAIVPTYGFNPFEELTTPDWDPAMKWNPISPRVGLSYDLFGDGKTAIKLSYSRYADSMPAMYFQGNHPFSQSQWGWNPLNFYWWDTNLNLEPDADDDFVLYGGAVSDYDPDPTTYLGKIGDDIKAPTYNEIVVGIDSELFSNFTLGVKYFFRNKKNALDTVLWDRTTNTPWYTYDQAPNWYVPFTTTVPATGEFAAQDVTLYYISADAPWTDRFYKFINVSESKRSYNALEITFDKRYANGWTLGGSVVYSKLWGNVAGTGGTAHGFSSAFNDANYMVNREGRDARDVPLSIKVYGSFDLPYGFIVSFYGTHRSGYVYQRTVSIVPPAAWAAANNALTLSASVNAEEQGSRRNQSLDNVDLRFEKEFQIGDFGRLGLHVDVYNLLGNRYVSTGLNPGGTWRPTGPNTSDGSYSRAGSYGRLNSVDGVRIFKISARFTF